MFTGLGCGGCHILLLLMALFNSPSDYYCLVVFINIKLVKIVANFGANIYV